MESFCGNFKRKKVAPPSDSGGWKGDRQDAEKEESQGELLMKENNFPEKGYVLYSIPQEMCLGFPNTCYISISFDKDVLLKSLPNYPNNTKIDGDFRISPIMEVNIKGNSAFKVEADSILRQPIDFIEGEKAEWKFKVIPLKQGKQTLKLEIYAIIVVYGEKVRKDLSFQKDILVLNIENPKCSEKEAATEKIGYQWITELKMEDEPKETLSNLGNPIIKTIAGILAATIISLLAYFGITNKRPVSINTKPSSYIVTGRLVNQNNEPLKKVKVGINTKFDYTDTQNGSFTISGVKIGKDGVLYFSIEIGKKTETLQKDTTEYLIEGDKISITKPIMIEIDTYVEPRTHKNKLPQEEKTTSKISPFSKNASTNNCTDFDLDGFKRELQNLNNSSDKFPDIKEKIEKADDCIEYNKADLASLESSFKNLEPPYDSHKQKDSFVAKVKLFINGIKKTNPLRPTDVTAFIQDGFLHIMTDDKSISDIRVKTAEGKLIQEILGYSERNNKIALEGLYNRPQRGDYITLEIYYKNGNSKTKTVQIR